MRKTYRAVVVMFCGVFLISHKLSATVYVIKEGGVEVGRWEEADGSDKTEVIDEDAPKAASEKVKAPEPMMGEAGYQFAKPEIPKENLATFKIGGRVVDVMNLSPAGGGEITFDGAGVSVKAVFGQNGIFSAELPKIEGGSYTVSVSAKGYSSPRTYIYLNGSPLRGMSQKERVILCDKIPQWTPIDKAYYSIEIGLCRDAMTEEEKKDYYEHMESVTRGGEEEP